MVSMEGPNGDRHERHLRRRSEALYRARVPTQDGPVIELSDQSSETPPTSVPSAGERSPSGTPNVPPAAEKAASNIIQDGRISYDIKPNFRQALKSIERLRRSQVPKADLVMLSSRGLIPREEWDEYKKTAEAYLRELSRQGRKQTKTPGKEKGPKKEPAPEASRSTTTRQQQENSQSGTPQNERSTEPTAAQQDLETENPNVQEALRRMEQIMMSDLVPRRDVAGRAMHGMNLTPDEQAEFMRIAQDQQRNGRRPPEPPQPPGSGELPPEAPPPESTISDHSREGIPVVFDPRRYIGVKIKPIREILASERDARLFSEVLRSINPEASETILQNYLEGTPADHEMDYMTYAAHEYAQRLKSAEETMALVSQEDVDRLAEGNPAFRSLLTHEGDRALEMVKGCILHQAMKQGGGVEDLRAVFKQITRDRDTYRHRRQERRIEDVCERLGVERKDFTAIYDPRTRDSLHDSRERMKELIHERAGKFRRALDWVDTHLAMLPIGPPLPGSSEFVARRTMRKAQKIERQDRGRTVMTFVSKGLQNRVGENLKYIAEYLGPTISDPEMRQIVALEALTNEDQKRAVEKGPQTFAQAQEKIKQKEFSPQEIEKRIKRRVSEDDKWASRSVSQQDAMLRGWKNEEKRSFEGSGIFAWLLELLFGNNWDKGAGAALGRPVHA